MKRTESGRKRARSNESCGNDDQESTRSREEVRVCVKNEGYPASLELRKIYRVDADVRAADHHLVRVIDESGEDYLYPADYFVPIELPQAVEEALALPPTSSLERTTAT
jgi:hypothetical protein